LFDKEIDLKNLEAFLLSIYQDNNELIKMEYSIPLLYDLDFNSSIAHIAEQLGYNLKTFQRHFIKHLSCSPVEYRRIVRFRHSIASKLNTDGVKSLTEITYESAYYDHSYFIKEFKKLTGHNPVEFFKVAKQVDGEKIVWKIL
jgi:YesN/AraC family two-component response regulator